MPSLCVPLPAAGFAFVLMCFAAVPVLEISPLETVSETSSNASIGDLNGDGQPDIVLVKGRHWQLTTKVFLGDGRGHFAPGPAGAGTGPLTKEHGVWVFHSGEPLPASATDEMLQQIREERDLANLGKGE